MISKAKVKYIQNLSLKKNRDADKVFVAEGPKLVLELLQENSFEMKEIFVLEEWQKTLKENFPSLNRSQIETLEKHELEKISSQKTPNQVLAIYSQKANQEISAVPGELIIALDGIQDPGNLGTIIRTADWFGIKKIICSEDTVDMYNSKVVQSTMASLGRVEVFYTDLSAWLPKQSVPTYITSMDGKKINASSTIKEGIIIIGNEGNGVRAAIEAIVHHKISIPAFGRAESLNAGVAAAIFMAMARL